MDEGCSPLSMHSCKHCDLGPRKTGQVIMPLEFARPHREAMHVLQQGDYRWDLIDSAGIQGSQLSSWLL